MEKAFGMDEGGEESGALLVGMLWDKPSAYFGIKFF